MIKAIQNKVTTGKQYDNKGDREQASYILRSTYKNISSRNNNKLDNSVKSFVK